MVEVGLYALFVSIIALVISITKDFIIPAVFKPNLTLEGKNDEECTDDALNKKIIEGIYVSGGKQVGFNYETNKAYYELRKESRWLRLRLKNHNGFLSRTAKNCYVKLIEIRNSNNQRIRSLNPFPLMWVSYTNSKNDLSKGEYHLLNLAFETKDQRVLFPATYGLFGLPHQLLERKEEKLAPGVYTFKIGVYGDNFNPIIKDFKVELTKKFGELRFADE